MDITAEWFIYNGLAGVLLVIVSMTPGWLIRWVVPRWFGIGLAAAVAIAIGKIGPQVIGHNWFDSGYFFGMVIGVFAGFAEAETRPERKLTPRSL